jgi:hypothetical protein
MAGRMGAEADCLAGWIESERATSIGLGLLEAVRVRDRIAAVLWLGAGLAFLAADNLRRGRFPLPTKSRS